MSEKPAAEEGTLCIGNERIAYAVRRRKMKHMRLRVEKGRAVVSCAPDVPAKTVERFIIDKWHWVCLLYTSPSPRDS